MWHKVSQVAKTHRFDENAFVSFAAENTDKFSLIVESDSLMVNTWNADSLIEQFKKQNPAPVSSASGNLNLY